MTDAELMTLLDLAYRNQVAPSEAQLRQGYEEAQGVPSVSRGMSPADEAKAQQGITAEDEVRREAAVQGKTPNRSSMTSD